MTRLAFVAALFVALFIGASFNARAIGTVASTNQPLPGVLITNNSGSGWVPTPNPCKGVGTGPGVATGLVASCYAGKKYYFNGVGSDQYTVYNGGATCAGTTGGSCTGGTATTCQFGNCGSPGAVTFTWGSTTIPSDVCPANSTMVGGACVCDLNYKPGGASSCVPVTCSAKPDEGSILGPFSSMPGKVGQNINWCDARTAAPTYGCSYQAHVTAEKMYPPTSSAEGWYQVVSGSYSGSGCNGGADTAAAAADPASGVSKTGTPIMPTPATTCTGNTCPGTVNGASVCVACSRVVTDDGRTVDGSKTTDTSGTPVSTSGNTKETKADCNGTVCQVTVTVRDLAGTIITQATGTQGKEQFCKENAKSAQCTGVGSGSGGSGGGGDEEGSAFGGACASGFTCDGDAVQCAMAQDQHIRHCQAFDLATAESTAGLALIAEGTAANYRPDGHPGKTPTEVNIGTMFSSSMLTNPLGSTCPGDQSIAGITLPLSRMCSSLQLLGTVAVALTVMVCAGWLVTKGV